MKGDSKVYCVICGVGLDALGLDNLSPICGAPVCECCAADMSDSDWKSLEQTVRAQDEEFLFCDDCKYFDSCFNAVDLGHICGDFEQA